jgi:response regulator RpfG family c-di-GMP phosphodiesterase
MIFAVKCNLSFVIGEYKKIDPYFGFEKLADTVSSGCSAPSNLKIAIVDDEMELTELYSKIFRALGYSSLSVFHDGASIVKFLATDHQFFDIIVMDYRMPEMNGIEAAKNDPKT